MSEADKRREWVLLALDEYELPLLRYALRLLGGAEDLARDAVQHAFLKLCDDACSPPLCGANPSRSDGLLAAWLFRVCRNRALDHLRLAGRERPLAEGNEVSEGGWLAGREPDPACVAESDELAGCLRELVGQLPPAQREAIDLWCEGFVYRQIAEIMDRQEGHIRVLVHRGLTRLRQHPQVRAWLDDDVGSACRAEPDCPEGATYASPGQRPG